MKKDALLRVLRDTRALLARPDNNFSWSSFGSAESALKEIDAWIDRVSIDATSDMHELRLLFSATGPIQEVTLSSGWGEAFLELADQFDDAMR